MPSSSGRVNEMLVVIKHNLWQGDVGKEIRNIFAEEVEGLPQPEPKYRVANVAPSAFNSVLRASRNILMVGIKDEVSPLNIKKDVYASPQIIEEVYAKSEADIIKTLRKNKKKLIAKFHNQDIKSIQKRLKKIARIDIPKFKEKGMSIILPNTFLPVEVQNDFWWYRSDIKEGKYYPLLNFILYITPLDVNSGFLEKNILKTRDSIAKKYIAGPTQNTYMQTELRTEYSPSMRDILVDEKIVVETKGLWKIKGDFMGGPFLSYTIYDEKNNRIITAEGFVYAAGTKKRDYMFEMEAILKSIEID